MRYSNPYKPGALVHHHAPVKGPNAVMPTHTDCGRKFAAVTNSHSNWKFVTCKTCKAAKAGEMERIIHKKGKGENLTVDEAKTLASYRRRNPAWAQLYESAVR